MKPMNSELEDIVYCTTGCGSNADPADGFGYCTCGAEELKAKIEVLIDKQVKQAFRDGQLDCQKAGDPTNHAHFQEAVNKQVLEARIDELERIMNGQITIRSFITGDGGEEQIVTYEFANNEIKDRIKELKDNL